jgi:hypothetical protein
MRIMDAELTKLLDKNRETIDELEKIAAEQKKNVDPRLMFTRIHTEISRGIIHNIKLFEKPKPLLRLNSHFAGDYIIALKDPKSFPNWKRAFDLCAAAADPQIQMANPNYSASTALPYDTGALQQCVEVMGDVHININIRSALVATSENGKCTVSTKDFGNMLDLIERGGAKVLDETFFWPANLVAKAAKKHVLPAVEKRWRNSTFTSICGEAVPDPEETFRTSVQPW